jgi:hypothetical protein
MGKKYWRKTEGNNGTKEIKEIKKGVRDHSC